MDYKGKILIGTVMLEKNRWTLEKVPTVKISDWLGTFAEDDFEGIELWENHVLRNPESELMKIKSCGLPLIYLSSYLKFDGSDDEEMQKVAEVAKELSAASIKFNFSNNIDLLETHIVKIRRFAELLPEDCSLLCECHANTIMADLNNAFKVFETLNDERFGIIIHLFDPLEILQKWFMAFGQKIKHVHIHLYDGGNIIALRNKPELLVKHLKFIHQMSFKGSYTGEFTKGVATPDEDIEDIYRNAVDDMKLIREVLSKVCSS